MNRVDVRRLAKRPKGSEVRLPPISERVSAVREYRTYLRRMLRETAKEVRTSVIPAFQADRRLRTLTRDNESWFFRLRAKQAELERAIEQFVQRLVRLEGRQHTDAFNRQAKRALNVDLEAVIREEDLADFLDDVVTRNVSLIRSLSQETFKRIEQAVLAAKIGGQSAKSLRKTLQKEFGVMASRAELIAQDQMAKLTSDLNRQRQQQIGVTEYVWTTSRDERVRQRHARLDGTTYKWGEETGAEQGLPPGQPIRCRCLAIGVVKF